MKPNRTLKRLMAVALLASLALVASDLRSIVERNPISTPGTRARR